MATTDSNGIVFLEETDPISPFHTTINTLQQGTSDAITGIKDGSNDILVVHQVADISERSSLATAYGPTASKPLYVDRQDAPAGQELERTEDGSTWTSIQSNISTAWTALSTVATANWNTPASASTPARFRSINGRGYFDGIIRNNTGLITPGSFTVATLPAMMRPSSEQWFLIAGWVSGGAADPYVDEIRIATNGTVTLIVNANRTGTYVSGLSWELA